MSARVIIDVVLCLGSISVKAGITIVIKDTDIPISKPIKLVAKVASTYRHVEIIYIV